MQVPEGWRYIDIGSIATVKVAGDVKKEFYSQHPTNTHCYPVYSNTIINKGLYGYYDFIEYENDAVTIVGRGIGIGTAFPRYKTSGFGAVGRLLIVFPKESSFDIRYFSESINFLLKIFYESGAIPQLPGYTLEKYKVLLPPLAEQEKIADILSTWDHTIEQTERLKANAETHKQALMQQLLTGKKRFPEFEGEWEAKVLGDIVKISKGQQKNRIDLTANGKYPVINGGIEPSGYTDEYNRMENIITISEGGNSCGYVNFIKTKFWCGGHCYSMLEPSIDNHFLFHALKFREKALMQLRVGSGLPNIQKRDVESFKIKYPKITEEQQKIAAVLSAADREIELLAQKLDHLKTEKRALMQQLLTGKRRVKVDG